MKKQIIFLLALCVILMNACQKERSFETGGSPSIASLQSDVNGDCLPKSVNGTYTVGTALVATTNTITVQLNVTQTGSYTVYTDTVNGYYFKGTGTFTTLGLTNITLQGHGTPFAAGTNNFIVTNGTSFCDIQVIVGGGTPATFTLGGAGGACTPSTVNGSYATTVALNASNTVTISVNVTVIGSYSIFTNTVGGMTFSKIGTFTATGVQNVTLSGTGTPTVAGNNTLTVTVGTATCTFVVNVGSPSAGTLGGAGGACTPSTVNGTYTVGTALTATNTVVVQVNVTTAGVYSITTNTVTGFSYAASGTFAATGAQNVTLIGTGTPATAGPQTFTVTYGASTCTFSVTVAGAAGATGTLGGAGGTCTPATVNGTYTMTTALTAANTVQVQVNVLTTGTYSITTNTVTGFSFAASGTFAATGTQNVTLAGTGTPSTAGPQTFTVTFGTSTCTFVVTVGSAGGPATGTLGGATGACTPSAVNGYYIVGVPVVAGNTVQVQANVTTTGTYSITTGTVTGFGFSATGTFAATGTQSVTLTSTGTPTTAGTQTFTVTWGTSTCTFTIFVLPNDYFPRTTNSNWSYEFDDDGLDSMLRKVYPQTLSALGNTYNIFMADDGTGFDSSGYYRRSTTPTTGDYYEWFDVGAFIGYDNPLWAEYIMVKDNVAQGNNWKSQGFAGTVGGTPLNLRFSYTILQKDVPIAVSTSLGSVTYQSVIVVEERVEAEVAPGVWQDVTSQIDYYGKSYYARGIGLIKFEGLDAASAITFKQELRRFQIF